MLTNLDVIDDMDTNNLILADSCFRCHIKGAIENKNSFIIGTFSVSLRCGNLFRKNFLLLVAFTQVIGVHGFPQLPISCRSKLCLFQRPFHCHFCHLVSLFSPQMISNFSSQGRDLQKLCLGMQNICPLLHSNAMG